MMLVSPGKLAELFQQPPQALEARLAAAGVQPTFVADGIAFYPEREAFAALKAKDEGQRDE